MVGQGGGGWVRSYAALSLGDAGQRLPLAERQALIESLCACLAKERVILTKIALYRTLCLLGEWLYFDALLGELSGARYQNRCFCAHTLEDVATASNRARIVQALCEQRDREKTVAVRSSIDAVLAQLGK